MRWLAAAPYLCWPNDASTEGVCAADRPPPALPYRHVCNLSTTFIFKLALKARDEIHQDRFVASPVVLFCLQQRSLPRSRVVVSVPCCHNRSEAEIQNSRWGHERIYLRLHLLQLNQCCAGDNHPEGGPWPSQNTLNVHEKPTVFSWYSSLMWSRD